MSSRAKSRDSGNALLLAAIVAIFLSFTRTANAADVQALNLPDEYTITPEGEHRVMTVAPDGTVFAIASPTDPHAALHPLALRWKSSQVPQKFSPLPIFGKPTQGMYPSVKAIVAVHGDAALMTVGQVFDGAYLGERYQIQEWTAQSTTRWSLPECAQYPIADPHILAMDSGGSIALTVDPSARSVGIDLSNAMSVERNLPVALVLNRGKCREMGTAILTAIDGSNVAGYRPYLDGKLAPWFINKMVQKQVAVRWIGSKETDLGPGIPFAMTSAGFTVGATSLPGHGGEYVYGNFFGPAGRYEYATPHAVAWQRDGKALTLTHNDMASVAWDVSEDGTVVGMEQSQNGKHFAFRWRGGHLQLLDDLPHPPGWRFESAYAVGTDGSIVGIGTFNNVPAAFIWRE